MSPSLLAFQPPVAAVGHRYGVGQVSGRQDVSPSPPVILRPVTAGG